MKKHVMPENRRKTGKRGGKRSTSFKPGQSGNPSGRPKKTDEQRRIEDMAKEHSQEALKALGKDAVDRDMRIVEGVA